jgi:MerR family transcriptional regulator/heat shock protein HspR
MFYYEHYLFYRVAGNTMKRKQGFFSISAVAKMFSVHQQTIRLYEREGLITPKRSDGNTRLFSEEDVDRLEEVIYLTHKLGINLAGVQMVLKLQKQIKKMQKDMNRMFEETNDSLKAEELTHQTAVKAATRRLADLKDAGPKITERQSSVVDAINQVEKEEWQVEYEE